MKREGKRRRIWIVILIIIAFLIIIRLLLPSMVLSHANKALAELDGYRGRIEDIDIAIIRGAYAAKGFSIDKIDSVSNKAVPFISTDVLDISVEWSPLFKGKIVGSLEFLNPVIRFENEKVEPEDLQDDTTDFRRVLKSFMPLKVNRFEVNNGQFQFIDSTIKPAVNVTIDSIYIIARNLSSADDTSALPASVNANAKVYGGSFNLKMKLNPMSEYPTYDMNMELENTNLRELNNFFKAYGKFDINKGSFGMYAEVAGKDKKFIGYVKPVIKDLDIVGPQDRKDSFLNRLWEGIVSIAGSILENKEEDQVATKIPISGDYDDPSIQTWYAILNVLRNAFVQAIYPSIDNQINLSSVKKVDKKDDEKETILEKIFNESDDKKDEGKDDKKDRKKREEKDRKKRKEKDKEENKQ
jgi:hypothetical protein